MTLSLDEDGLHTQTQEEIAEELTERLRAKFGQNIDTGAKSILGQIVNEFAELRALDQQTLLAVYQSFDPAGARGRALDARSGLTGTTRDGATHSSVVGLLDFNVGDTIAAGFLIRNEDNGTLWELDSEVLAMAAGTEEATFIAVDTGPILANAGTTWSIVTVAASIDSFTNGVDDAEPGRDRESDADLRKRRLGELFAAGQGPLATIQARVLRVEGVLSCRVYHNPLGLTADADGIPPKAFNVVVETEPANPGAALEQAILDAIWSGMGAGGYAYGTDVTGLVVDSEGANQAVAFDLVDEVDIILEIDLGTSASEDPITPDIEALVAARILEVAQADHEVPGRDVRRIDYQGIVYDMLAAGEISGVVDVTVRMAIDPDAAAAQAKLTISIRQKPDFDSANITVAQV